MCQVDKGRRFPAIAITALLLCAPVLLLAQNQVRPEENAPLQPAAPAPALHPTPEQLGDAYLAHQRYQEAIAAYKKAPKLTAAIWNKMGIAHELMLDPNAAERCYKESLRLEPHDARVINNLGTVYDSEKRFKSAEKMYRRAIKQDPTSAIVEKNLGTNLLARHKYPQGLEAYRKALALDAHIFDQSGDSQVQNTASLQERGAMNYYMAKSCVQAGLAERAIQFLRLALSEGFTSPKKVAEDSTFAKLHDNPEFQQLITEHHAQ